VGDGGIDQGKQFLLPIGYAVHYIFGDVDDLDNLRLLFTFQNDLPLDLNVPCKNSLLIFLFLTLVQNLIFFNLLWLFNEIFNHNLIVLTDVVQNEYHLVELLNVDLTHLIQRIAILFEYNGWFPYLFWAHDLWLLQCLIGLIKVIPVQFENLCSYKTILMFGLINVLISPIGQKSIIRS